MTWLIHGGYFVIIKTQVYCSLRKHIRWVLDDSMSTHNIGFYEDFYEEISIIIP